MLVVVVACTTIVVLVVSLICTTPPIALDMSNNVALVPKSKTFTIRLFMSHFQNFFVISEEMMGEEGVMLDNKVMLETNYPLRLIN
jgi:hypothetical protein